MDTLTLKKIIKHIENVINYMPQLKRFHISWFGGEPLLFFDKVIDPIMKEAGELFARKNIVFTTGFTTNGFLINLNMIKRFKSYNKPTFQITLDGNKEQHNTVRYVNKKRGSYDDIIKNIIGLCENKFSVTLRINYTKTNLKDIEDIITDLKFSKESDKKNIIIEFHKVWQELDLSLDSKIRELQSLFIKSGFRVNNGDIPNNLRTSCYADRKNHATINYNGEVFKCTARNFSSNLKEGDLLEDGTINWNKKFHDRMNIKFKNKPCLSCPIMPICNGGCSQVAIENMGQDYCVYNFDEHRKKEIVLNKYVQLMSLSSL